MRSRVALLALLISVLPVAAETLTGPAIRELFEDATVSGRYVDGRGYFTEYHGVDGRALGHNGFNRNVDACWNVDGDAVCYHYGQPEDRRTYCFSVERAGETYLLRVARSGQLNAIAQVERGNPRAHDDGGHRWSCEGLISRRKGPQRYSRLLRPGQ